MELTCNRCGLVTEQSKAKLETVGKHTKASCPGCGGYIKFIQQTEPSGDDILPFGKYKDKTVDWICTNDNYYALWAAENLKGRYKKSFKKCLDI